MRVIGRITAQRDPLDQRWDFYISPYTANMKFNCDGIILRAEIAAMDDNALMWAVLRTACMSWPKRNHTWRVKAWRTAKHTMVVRMSRTWMLTLDQRPPEHELFVGAAAVEHWIRLLRLANASEV